MEWWVQFPTVSQNLLDDRWSGQRGCHIWALFGVILSTIHSKGVLGIGDVVFGSDMHNQFTLA